jgi:hypothetical protein
MSEEKWLPVVGFEGLYEVSDHGRVYSLWQDKLVKPHVGTKVGHLRVSLKPPVGGEYKGKYIHTLVLEAFVEPRPDGMEACHNDGVAGNNRLENLRWDTHAANMMDIVRHGDHYQASKTHCPRGHLFDRTYYAPDGSLGHRYCSTCKHGDTCPQGHQFDGVAYWPDGSERLRFCKQCKAEKARKQMEKRYEVPQTHCKNGHLIEGVRMRGGVQHRYCVTCNSASSRASAARKKAKMRGENA